MRLVVRSYRLWVGGNETLSERSVARFTSAPCRRAAIVFTRARGAGGWRPRPGCGRGWAGGRRRHRVESARPRRVALAWACARECHSATRTARAYRGSAERIRTTVCILTRSFRIPLHHLPLVPLQDRLGCFNVRSPVGDLFHLAGSDALEELRLPFDASRPELVLLSLTSGVVCRVWSQNRIGLVLFPEQLRDAEAVDVVFVRRAGANRVPDSPEQQRQLAFAASCPPKPPGGVVHSARIMHGGVRCRKRSLAECGWARCRGWPRLPPALPLPDVRQRGGDGGPSAPAEA